MPSIEIEVWCSCGNDISDQVKDVKGGIEVEPCEECLDIARGQNHDEDFDEGFNKGHDEGHDKGFAKGYEEGHSDGYDAGSRDGYEDAKDEN